MSKAGIMIGIVAVVYALYIYQVFKDSGKAFALGKLQEHIVVCGGTIAILVGSVWLAKIVSNWFGLVSSIAKLLVWLFIVVAIPVLIILAFLPKLKK